MTRRADLFPPDRKLQAWMVVAVLTAAASTAFAIAAVAWLSLFQWRLGVIVALFAVSGFVAGPGRRVRKNRAPIRRHDERAGVRTLHRVPNRGGARHSPRTARRVLQQLVAEEWAEREPKTHRYVLNANLPSIAAQAVERSHYVKAAMPRLRELAADLATVTDLFVPSYLNVVSLAHVMARGEARVGIGGLVPRHCSAAGRVLLAFRDQWRRPLSDGTLEPRTDRTIIDPDAFTTLLDEVRFSRMGTRGPGPRAG